ncbi:MAG: tetratricopeptide repeat protein, partial [Candidatus Eremiobacteraeota bacterium]|nr:tetratricopeptide repeat protein [Candidatus Eremiobacteraeota bacterium]
RDADLAELAALLSRDDVQLLTIWGPPGVGKTSIAVRVAVDSAVRFRDGAAFIECASLADGAALPAAVAQVLGIRESGQTSPRESLIEALRHRTMLLVLDNFEHLRSAAEWLAELLEACSSLKVIVTSRELMHLRTEHAYVLRPLETRAAVELFAQRAQAVIPGFTLNAGNDDAVTSIVRRLEGLPLAIELAAPRLRLLPPKALAARLDRRLPLLGEGPLDLPQRQQTMRAAIGWSYDLLGADEQSLFRTLCILQAGGSLEAARAVAGDDAGDAHAFLLRIAGLVEKSMLSLEETPDGEARVVILEMLREFGMERLSESDEYGEARRRHAHHFGEFAGDARRRLDGPEQALWLGRLEREHPNFRAALQWSVDTGDVAFGLRLACSLWRLWWTRGYVREGVAWIRRLLDSAEIRNVSIPAKLRAETLRVLAVLLSALAQFDEAVRLCETSLRIYTEAGDDHGSAATLTSLGIARQFLGDYSGATAAHEKSLALRRALGDEAGIATSLSNLASIAFTTGDSQRTISLGEESAALYRRLGNARGVAHALTKLALAAEQLGRLEQAERLHQECYDVHRTLGSHGNAVLALINLGSVAHKRGDTRLALERYRDALRAIEQLPSKAALASLFENIAVTMVATHDTRRAVRILGAAQALRETVGSPRFPTEEPDYERTVVAARESLGSAVFDAERQIGASMSDDRLADEARDAVDALLASHLLGTANAAR